MLASELTKKLQAEIDSFGDKEVIFNSDCVECLDCSEEDNCECLHFTIGKIVLYSDFKGNRKYMLTCGECSEN